MHGTQGPAHASSLINCNKLVPERVSGPEPTRWQSCTQEACVKYVMPPVVWTVVLVQGGGPTGTHLSCAPAFTLMQTAAHVARTNALLGLRDAGDGAEPAEFTVTYFDGISEHQVSRVLTLASKLNIYAAGKKLPRRS